MKCLFLYLKLNTILQIGTSSSNIIRLHIDSFNVSDKWNMQGFERMLSYEQYPEEKSRLCLSSFKKKLINLHGGLLDVTTNIYLKSCAYHPDSECCTFFHGNLSDPKSSEDTLLYLYVIWNMLKSADLHETILTPVICHKHVRYHDAVKKKRKKKNTGKLRMNANKHWESESINRNCQRQYHM